MSDSSPLRTPADPPAGMHCSLDLQRWTVELEEFVREVSDELAEIHGLLGDSVPVPRKQEEPGAPLPPARLAPDPAPAPEITPGPRAESRATDRRSADSRAGRLQSLQARLASVTASSSLPSAAPPSGSLASGPREARP